MDKHESLIKKKAKRRKKRTVGRCSTHDIPELVITEKGKAYFISLGAREEDFHEVYR